MAPPEFATTEGRVLYSILEPAMLASRTFGGPTFERLLLVRHRLIDDLLRRAIDDGRVAQVVEVAAGLSPRGWRFAGEVTYVEADLPNMAARKRRLLDDVGFEASGHRVVELDALKEDGPGSLASIAATLDRDRGLAIIAEGLLNYFERDAVEDMWRRFAGVLAGFPTGLYLSDLLLASENSGFTADALRVLLSAFVRGRVHLHFEDEGEATAALERAGFAHARLHRPEGAQVRVVEASAG